MLKFSAIDQAKEKASANQEQNKKQYEIIFREAVELFEKSMKMKQVPALKKAMERFAAALKYNSGNLEPYFYMGVGFFLVNNKKLAKEYLGIVKQGNANYPGLVKLLTLVN